MTLPLLIWILVPVALSLGAGWLALRVLFRRLRETVRTRFEGAEIVRSSMMANFFGRQSDGLRQIRGNGALVLTPDELWFMRALPRAEYRIPLKNVTAVSSPRSFLGKTRFSALLRVHYSLPDGAEDAMAWQVSDHSGWTEDIERYAGILGQ